MYKALGLEKENIIMTDSKGVIRSDRKNLSKEKAEFATKLKLNSLEEAMKGADVFIGLIQGRYGNSKHASFNV